MRVCKLAPSVVTEGSRKRERIGQNLGVPFFLEMALQVGDQGLDYALINRRPGLGIHTP